MSTGRGRGGLGEADAFVDRYENADCLVGVHRDQEVNSSKALTLDLRQVSLQGTESRAVLISRVQYAE